MHLSRIARTFVVAALLFAALSSQAFAGCQPGDKADVLWKGSWYPATVLDARGHKCFIHYDGYDNSWDEWVGPNRIRIKGSSYAPPPPRTSGYFGEGDPVLVLWKGNWYPAHVLRAKGSQTYIHYDGYENSWDEWVGPDRIRGR